ncbi:sensor histidine kinase [Paenibacillus psychroresistens]|uniref:Sensor histidine kinase n=1 Tax=Paenibacillus psychroresistens TaxID=1778678 RepID=A0A6B8RTZ1_9BACL|nr:sensor histidine kinase [Paenibacillus psychroresistens]QGQ98776.1 sensor histidine kinase [Paenibacillus psychroresistens]
MNIQISDSIDTNILSLQKQTEAIVYNITDMKDYIHYTKDSIDENYSLTANRLNQFFTSILYNNDRYNGIGLAQLNGDIMNYVNLDGYIIKGSSKIPKLPLDEIIKQNGAPVTAIIDLNTYFKNNSITPKNNDVIAVYRLLSDYNSGNTPIGISIFTQELIKFGGIVTDGKVDPDETVIILNNDDKLLYTSQKMTGSLTELVSDIHKQLTADKKQVVFENDQSHLIVSNSSRLGFKVITIVPKSVVIDKLSVVTKSFLLLQIFLVLSVLVTSNIISRYITAPLIKLKRSFKKFEMGDFSTKTIVKGTDEFAEISSGFNTMTENVTTLIKEKYEMELYQKQSEIESLQSKINPHFLYNTLSTIKAVIQNNDADNAARMVQYLSDIFRYSLNYGHFVVTIQEEIEIVKKYLALQKLRFGETIQISFDVDEDILHSEILRLSIQPLVENAILHGLEDNAEERNIHISLKSYTNTVSVYIEDNGRGMDKEKLDQLNALLAESPSLDKNNPARNFVGISNVNSRIKLFYGNEFGVHVMSKLNEGTIVRINLPLTLEG